MPSATTAAGHLTAGTYRVTVQVTDRSGEQHTWTPTIEVVVDVRKGTIRHDPVTVQITDPPRRP